MAACKPSSKEDPRAKSGQCEKTSLACRRLRLSNGRYTLLDATDYTNLRAFRWHCNSYGYAYRHIWLHGKLTSSMLHRERVGLRIGDKRQVDHINHKTLDNRRANIRVVTHRENHANRRKQSPHGVGVGLVRSGRYTASVGVGKRRVHIGTFDTARAARAARATWLEENKCP